LLLDFYNAEQLEQLSLMEQAISQVWVGMLSERYSEVGLTTRYYTTELHGAAFVLPAFTLEAISN
jgi:spermidine synthase